MSERTRHMGLFCAAVGLSAASFVGGQFGDVTMREPRVLATFVAMLVTFLAVLYFGDERPRP